MVYNGIVLHSQLDTSLAFKCIFFFFSFCRDKYNWAEEIDVAGDIVAGQWGHNYQRNWYADPEPDIILGMFFNYFMHIMSRHFAPSWGV